MITKLPVYIMFMVCIFSASAESRVTLPRLIADGMVLQRDARIAIWGWADPHESITLQFRTVRCRTTADDSGRWTIILKPMRPGPSATMTIAGSDTVTIRDILIGDVWLCSGQSNMELPMRRVRPLYESDIERAANLAIRSFTVPQTYDFTQPHRDLTGGRWIKADPVTVQDFSAVAYFFAQALYEHTHVPIGIINASLGGSPAEAWMSEDALKQFPGMYREVQRLKDSRIIDSVEARDRARSTAWYTALWQNDRGGTNHAQIIWKDTAAVTADWDTMSVPGYWEKTKLGGVNGAVWFRRTFTLPAQKAGTRAKLNLGRIVDADSVFINGVFVGTTGYQYPPRWYTVPENVLRAGSNTIVVRVISTIGTGGFVPDKPYELAIGDDVIDLKGVWQYRLGASMEPLQSQTFFRWKPAGLYNAMLAPLFRYAIKGVAWYQGESNAGRAVEYRTLLPALIADWRRHWKNVPFVIAQLPNFMEAQSEPSESGWAMLREAQLQTLSVPKTALAVTIDLGEWNDVHPLRKKEVGERLALAARKAAYDEQHGVFSGPLYRSMAIDGGKIRVHFTETDGGLVAKNGRDLSAFAIAGADKKFVWAHAAIELDHVVVWSDAVAEPRYVRYAWANNPAGANLYNKAGLPASPFRTDRDEIVADGHQR